MGRWSLPGRSAVDAVPANTDDPDHRRCRVAPWNGRAGDPLSRRRVLTTCGAAVSAAIAGCSTVVDTVGNRLLEDVSVFNQLNRGVDGVVEVVGPAGDGVLDEPFTIPAVGATGEGNGVTYDDVWVRAGEYEITIALTNTVIETTERTTETVRITDTDDEMAVVALGGDAADEPIAIRVATDLSDVTWDE